MNAPNNEAKVNVTSDDETPAAVPDSDAEAHSINSTKNQSLPKLKISSSFVSPFDLKKVQKNDKKIILKHIKIGPAQSMKPFAQSLYTLVHDCSHPSGNINC